MKFTFTDEQNEFRQEIRDFLKAELEGLVVSGHTGGLITGSSREFSRKMADKGWIGFTWPRQYGGQGRKYVEKTILMEELLRAQAPIAYHFLADRQVGPAIIRFGSDWQKEYFIPRIVNADDGMMFCLLFSEPNAGSDLAAVATKAVKEGDDYVVNGQKVWTSAAHNADFGWLLAKTDFDSSTNRYNSCSEFIVDMKSPGITINPIINMAGEHSFNEVFFDDVRIDRKYMVGEENAGFSQIMAQMDYERAGIERMLQNYPVYERLISHAKELKKDGERAELYHWARDSIAQLEIEYNIGRLLCYYTSWVIDEGKKPTSQAALCKAFCTQYEQRLNDVATSVLGPISIIKKGSDWSPFDGQLAECYLWAPSYTLQGGSVEVLKNILALRGLGLPRK
jgi:alkylation response protein AidB-like acyl-CoA dehydrogenase